MLYRHNVTIQARVMRASAPLLIDLTAVRSGVGVTAGASEDDDITFASESVSAWGEVAAYRIKPPITSMLRPKIACHVMNYGPQPAYTPSTALAQIRVRYYKPGATLPDASTAGASGAIAVWNEVGAAGSYMDVELHIERQHSAGR